MVDSSAPPCERDCLAVASVFALAFASGGAHLAVSPMDLERDGNLIEAGVWFLLAIVLFIHTVRSEKRLRPTLFILVGTLVVFGVSDLVESRTGAWWKPWWLFVWKAVCVLVLVLGFIRYCRLTKARKVASDDSRADLRGK